MKTHFICVRAVHSSPSKELRCWVTLSSFADKHVNDCVILVNLLGPSLQSSFACLTQNVERRTRTDVLTFTMPDLSETVTVSQSINNNNE